MKKIILTVATVLTLGLTFAQECKSVKVEVDSYTGERTIETEFIDFNGGTYEVSKRPYGIALWLQLESSIILSIDKGDIIYFKLSDNSVIKFVNRRLSMADYSKTIGYSNSFGFILDQEVLDALMNKEVIGIKCSVNEYNLSAKESATLKNNINCIVNTK
jgi:hypothetical protein